MNAVRSNRNYLWSALWMSLCVAACALIVVRVFAQVDSEIAGRLLRIFNIIPASAASKAAEDGSLIHEFGQGILALLFAAAAIWSGFRLSAVPRVLVLVQLFVLSLLAMAGIQQLFHIPAHPLGCFTAVFIGTVAGYGLRALDLQRRKWESQCFELLLRNKELQDARLLLVKQDEVERRMLAADLHDQVLNDLKAGRQMLESFAADHAAVQADAIKSLLDRAMQEIREVMDSLCPSVLEHLGLAAAIEDCLRRGSVRSGFKVRFKNKVADGRLAEYSMVEQALLYRLVQESITNICKHACASQVRGTIVVDGEALLIRVTDNGRGIDPGAFRQDSRGVRYMRQRADLIGATIAWLPGEDGRGTIVEIRVGLPGNKDGESSGSRGRISAAAARDAADQGEDSGTAGSD